MPQTFSLEEAKKPAAPAGLGGATAPKKQELPGYAAAFDAGMATAQPDPGPDPSLTAATTAPAPSIWTRMGFSDDPKKSRMENILGWDFEKPVIDNVLSPTILNAADRVGLAAGWIDPATYRGRGAQDPHAPTTINAPPPRTTWDIMRDSASDMFSEGGMGIDAALMRTNRSLREEDLINSEANNGRITRAQADADIARTRAADAASIQEIRAQRAQRDAADPIWQPGGGMLNNLLREGGSFAGGIVGDINPTYAIGGELIPAARVTTPILERLLPTLAPKIAPTVGRMASMGSVNAGIDAGIQGSEIHEGIQDKFDPARAGMSFAMGAAIPGAIDALPALRHWWASRGVKTEHLSDEQLVTGSLDGSVTDGQTSPDQIRAMLQGAGATEPQAAAMSPEFAALAAGRVGKARARVPNVDPAELARRSGIAASIENGITDPSHMPNPTPRTVPDATTIIGAPEGNVRSDDAGAIAGLDRKRAGDANFFDRAQSRLAQDPVVAEVLNAPVSAQTKIKTLWDRIAATREAVDGHPEELPWQAPTAKQARTAGQPPATFDRMLGAESGGHQFGRDGAPLRSSKGAVGKAQVMPATGPEAARLAGVPWDVARFEKDAAYNERLGRAYHSEMLRRFDGDERMAAAAYNAGPGRVERAIKKGGAGGWEAHIPDETKAYLGKVLGDRPAAEAPFRMSAPDEAGDGLYSSRDRVRRNLDDPGSPPVREDFQGWEKTDEQLSPTNAELEQGKVRQRGGQFTDAGNGAPYEPRMRAGGSTRAFKAVGDDPAGAPGFWEQRAREQGDAAFTRAQADLEAEWARRAEAQQLADPVNHPVPQRAA
ncbi:MAG: transglycosylase SLT domain-containing protein, partial [Casimicrobiaceae bacterium]